MGKAIIDDGVIPSEKTIQLITPIVLADKTITELKLREPTAGELDNAESKSETDNGTAIYLISAVADLHIDVVKQLRARDFHAAARYLKSFLQIRP